MMQSQWDDGRQRDTVAEVQAWEGVGKAAGKTESIRLMYQLLQCIFVKNC